MEFKCDSIVPESVDSSSSSAMFQCSDSLLELYSSADLFLLWINLTVIVTPVGRWLWNRAVARPWFLNCVKRVSEWRTLDQLRTRCFSNNPNSGKDSNNVTSRNVPSSNHNNSNPYKPHPRTIQFKSSLNVDLENGVSLSTVTTTSPASTPTPNDSDTVCDSSVTSPLNPPDHTATTFTAGHQPPLTINESASSRSTSHCSSSQCNSLSDIITQIFYILLFLVYLASVLEFAILLVRKQHYFRPDVLVNNSTRTLAVPATRMLFDLIPVELMASLLTILVHFFTYGISYHQLWLHDDRPIVSSYAKPRLASSLSSSPNHRHQSYRYHTALNLCAFIYFLLNLLGNLVKLLSSSVMFFLLVSVNNNKSSSQSSKSPLRPYLLFSMFLLQTFFAIKHLNHLIIINKLRTRRHKTQAARHTSSFQSKSNQIKYCRNRSPFLSKMTFSWFFGMLRLGYRKNFEINDLGLLPNEEQANSQFERFYENYKLININSHPTSFLWRICWRTYKRTLVIGGLIKILSDLSSLIGPMSIGLIINYITNLQNSEEFPESQTSDPNGLVIVSGNSPLSIEYLSCEQFFSNAYVLSIVVLVATFLQSTLSNNFNHLVISEGIHLKTALNCCIYNKLLRIPISNSGLDPGVISNFMSVDSSNIFQFFTMKHYLWAVPIKIVVLMYLLYKQMGISAIMGSSIFFILSPFQYYCSKQISRIQKLQMDISDKRLSKTTELFMGIKLLKLLGWDLSFANHIKSFRDIELKYLQKDAIYVAINTFITQGSAILVTLVTFNMYAYVENQPLDAATVFTSIALFNQMTVPLYIVPLVIPMLISAVVSHQRLVNFLGLPELNSESVRWEDNPIRKANSVPHSAPIFCGKNQTHKSLDRSNSASITRTQRQNSKSTDLCCYIKNATFSWSEDDSTDSTLSDVSVEIPRNKLTILAGWTGSGKSTFLASLLGETFLINGNVHWLVENNFGFGYVPSNPWILNVSLLDNITFGSVFERKRYEEVVRACCLQADIDLLPFGEKTIIGERGITLSGGQKQRVALARALYSYAPTLILDDCLSALDPIVGYSVFDNAIMRLAVKNQKRTVILSTHKHEFLSQADYVIVMEAGAIKNQGTYNQIEKKDKAFFYQWNVIKEKEIQERLCQKPQTCKTTVERNQLVRLLSKKGEFRGPIKRENQCSMKFKRKPKYLSSRQMSYDTTNALPCHDLGDCEDIIHESELEMSPSFTHFSNLSDSLDISKSHLSLTSSNSLCESANLNSQNSMCRPTFLRLNSRISNYSNAPNSVIEEEENEDIDENNHQGYNDQGKGENNDDDDDDSSSSSSPIEDTTQEATEELKKEIDSYNENQVESATINQVNANSGRISHLTYLAYLKAHSYSLGVFVFTLIILNQAIRVFSDFWLANWTNNDETRAELAAHELHPVNGTTEIVQETADYSGVGYYIKVYTILSLVSVIISLATNVVAQLVAIRAVRLLHDNLLSTLVRCPLRFFDKTPIGRILNRFTNDINVIDKKLPIAIPVLFRFLLLCISAIVVNIIITPYFIVAIIPILVIYYYLQKIFRCTSRQLQRLELSSKSPIISHFNQTIDGLTTIRAFHEQLMFKDKFYELLNNNNLCFLMVNSANCCLGISLDYLGGIILFIATLISITAALYWDVQSAFVGLAMTYTLLVPVYLNWLVRNLASVEMNMNSVERIYHYSQLEIEDSCLNRLKISDRSVPKCWPTNGQIEFQDVSVRYETNFAPIIQNANLLIQAGEKIGICGRTGSGKSSLIGALFRINQISNGQILIDGIDITHICPYKLRKRLSIIPQDMVLFTGTIRNNLDPGGQNTDEEIWKLLKDFRLDKKITYLDEEVGDEQRFSSGERQLLGCARAFLRNSPILIMDESTAMLDQKSENLVLEQIFRSKKTIIQIAHRVWNIAKFDKVVVVNEGKLAEFDTPDNLLRNYNSIFYSLYHKKYKSSIQSESA